MTEHLIEAHFEVSSSAVAARTREMVIARMAAVLPDGGGDAQRRAAETYDMVVEMMKALGGQ